MTGRDRRDPVERLRRVEVLGRHLTADVDAGDRAWRRIDRELVEVFARLSEVEGTLKKLLARMTALEKALTVLTGRPARQLLGRAQWEQSRLGRLRRQLDTLERDLGLVVSGDPQQVAVAARLMRKRRVIEGEAQPVPQSGPAVGPGASRSDDRGGAE